MKIRRKFLAAILVCGGVLASSVISPAWALGIIGGCAAYLWMDYDLHREKWLKMRDQIIKQYGGWYL